MNTIIRIMEVIRDLINVVFLIVFKIFDFIDEITNKRIESLRWWLVKRHRRITARDFNQLKWNCLMTIIKLLGFVYPLTGIVYFYILQRGKENIQRTVFCVNRALLPIFMAWALVKWNFTWGQQMDGFWTNIIVNYLIMFNPIRAALSILYFNLNYLNKDFIEQDPSEWAIDEEKEKEKLDEYDEYGDK